jgi:hypothetical protein
VKKVRKKNIGDGVDSIVNVSILEKDDSNIIEKGSTADKEKKRKKKKLKENKKLKKKEIIEEIKRVESELKEKGNRKLIINY